MNVMTMSTRFAATGAAAALAAAALVGVTTTTANAAPVTNTYVCQNPDVPGVGPWTVTLLTDAVGVDTFPSIPAGFDVSAGFVTLDNTFTIPKAAYDTLVSYNVEDISFAEFAGSFGDNEIGVTGMAAKVSEMTASADGTTYSFDADGSNEFFEVPAAGTYDVLSPSGFNMVASVPGIGNVPVACALSAGTSPGAYASLPVTKNASTTTGKPVARTLKTTKVAKMKVAVAADNEIPGGKVLVKEGTKTLGSATLNDAGKATVKMGKLKKGKHTVKVVYKGDGYTVKSTSEKITFTVKRP